MKISLLIGFIALVVVVIIGAAGAAPLPGEFYGTVTIDGAPAPVGTHVTATIANQECGSALIVREGMYGQQPDTLDPSFIVSCPDARDNDRIHFFINGYMARESRDFDPDGLTRLDLSVDRSIHIPPAVDFSAEPTSGNAPLAVQFTDTSVSCPLSWVWDFGDASAPSFVRNPVHIFLKPGVYDVVHTAVNATGTNHIEKTGFVTVYPVGDIDHNWRIDVDDVLMLENISAGELAPDPGADLNHDGVVDNADISLMQYYYHGK